MRVILLGCPGAGKGTQAKSITEKYHIPHISTGEILRAAIQQNSDLGRSVKAIVDSGQLVPDEVVTELVRERIKQPDCVNGFLLDGYPRNVAQARTLETLTPIDYVIDIDVPEEEIVSRLSGRRIHPGSGRTYHLVFNPPKLPGKDDVTGEPLIQRPDDSEDTIRKRLAVYHEQTSPLRDYYQQHKVTSGKSSPQYVRIDGMGSVDDITKKILLMLDEPSLL